jgi:arylformamidase
MIRVWLSTPFDGGRHERRLNEVAGIEKGLRASRGRVYDLSVNIEPGMLLWPGDGQVSIEKRECPGVASLTRLSLSAHSGSHVDAPAHILPDGTGVDGISLETLMGLARLCQLGAVKKIDRAVLETQSLDGVTRCYWALLTLPC